MPLKTQKPILYLITSGATTAATRISSKEFQDLLTLVRAAVAAHIDLVQLREKNLTARMLYELTARAAEMTRDSGTRLLINDRSDVAEAAGADGVHLTTNSVEASVIRGTFGREFVIGVSTHSLSEACAARDAGADFAVFGPVFETGSKRQYGSPVGLEALREAAGALASFPILAIGGISLTNASACLRAGAGGIAAIGLFANSESLKSVVAAITEQADD
ncbi:MAG: thiamine phosphate synthase [Pyrinomonadaceae bacterium]